MPRAAEVASDWKDMQVPGAWETRGLPDFDGVVWFTDADRKTAHVAWGSVTRKDATPK